MDLVTDAKEITNVISEIKQINNVANIYKTTKSEIDLDLILNVKAFHAKQVKEDALNLTYDNEEHDHHKHDEHEHHHHHGEEEHHEHHHHDNNNSHVKHSNVTTITLISKIPVDLPTFNQWLGEIIWIEPDDEEEENEEDKKMTSTDNDTNGSKPTPQIFRMKGIISVVNDDKKYILQAVNDLFECEPLDDETEGMWGKEEERISRIVVIGRYLDSLRLYNDSFFVKK